MDRCPSWMYYCTTRQMAASPLASTGRPPILTITLTSSPTTLSPTFVISFQQMQSVVADMTHDGSESYILTMYMNEQLNFDGGIEHTIKVLHKFLSYVPRQR